MCTTYPGKLHSEINVEQYYLEIYFKLGSCHKPLTLFASSNMIHLPQVILPWQFSISLSLEGHWDPPYMGVGLVHDRFLVLVPRVSSAQSLEHVDQSCHVDQPPSIAIDYYTINVNHFID